MFIKNSSYKKQIFMVPMSSLLVDFMVNHKNVFLKSRVTLTLRQNADSCLLQIFLMIFKKNVHENPSKNAVDREWTQM